MEKDFTVTKIDATFHSEYRQKRDCFAQIEEYLKDEQPQSKICAITGLKYTGKTVLLHQSIESLSACEKEKALLIECFDGTDFYKLYFFLHEQIQIGFKYFFIEELTCAEGFMRIGNLLADRFVSQNGAKIVFTASDSLAVIMGAKDILYDKMLFIKTTRVPFAEYARITGINSMDTFMKKGGTLQTDCFATKQSTDDYIETAIVSNILRSLKQNEDIDRFALLLTQKYDDDTLRHEIVKLIRTICQEKIFHILTKGSLSEASSEPFQENDHQKKQEIYAKIGHLLECDSPSDLPEYDSEQLLKNLYEIELFEHVPAHNTLSEQTSDKSLTIITHPGIFYAYLVYTIDFLKKDTTCALPENAYLDALCVHKFSDLLHS